MTVFRFLAAGLLVALLLFWGLGSPALDNQEARVGAVVQHMEDTGNLLVPYIGPTRYFNKPLLGPWLVLLSSRFLGLSETAVRFPSVLAALGVIWLTWLLARQWYGKETALLACLVLAGTFSFVQWSRAGRVEMLNLLAILAAFVLFFRYRDSGKVRWWYAMALVMGVGAHFKGLLTFAVPGFAVLALSIVFTDWKWLRPRHLAGAGAIAAAVYAVPFVLTWSVSGSIESVEAVYRENILRMVSPFDHIEPFYFYGYEFFRFTLPWSVLFPWLAVYLVLNRRALSHETKQLLVVIAAVVAFFQLSSSRRAYYMLPVLPFTSILLAYFLGSLPEAGYSWRKSVGWLWTIIGAAMTAPLLVLVLARRTWLEAVTGRYAGDEATQAGVLQFLYASQVFLFALACCLIGCLFICASRKLTHGRVRLIATAGCTVLAVFFGLVKPALEVSGDIRVLASDVRRIVPGTPHLLAFTPSLAHASALIYYLRLHNCRVFVEPAEAEKEMLAGGGFLLIRDNELPATSWKLLRTEGGWNVRGRRSNRWRLYQPRSGLEGTVDEVD